MNRTACLWLATTRILFILVMFLMINGCGSQKIAPQNMKQYNLLFSKKINGQGGQGCISAYYSEGLLYIVSKEPRTVTNVVVYDKRTGLFASVPLYQSKMGDCRVIDLNVDKPMQAASVNYFDSQEFKVLFDSVKQDPDALKNAITAGPPYFRHDGKFNNQRSAVNLIKPRILNIRQLSDVANYLNGINSATAAEIIGPRASQMNRADKREEERRQNRMKAKADWDNRLAHKLKVGDKICSYKNSWFGYVDTLQDNRIKMHVIGQAITFSGPVNDGYYFSGLYGNFTYDKIDSIRWLNRDEVALCMFE